MSGHGEKLNRKHEQAVAALVTQPSIAAAAEVIGVSDRTMLRWLALPEFAASYRAARREVVSHSTVKLQQAAGAAVDTLTAVMEDTAATPASRVSAARAVLELAFRAVEVEDLMARIETLEERYATKR